MNKTQKFEEIFKSAHLAAKQCPAPIFSTNWENRLMNEIRIVARSQQATENNDTALNVFAFRLGWAMLVFAFAISPVLYFLGINSLSSLNKTESVTNSSLWELVDQNTNIEDISFLNETSSTETKEIK